MDNGIDQKFSKQNSDTKQVDDTIKKNEIISKIISDSEDNSLMNGRPDQIKLKEDFSDEKITVADEAQTESDAIISDNDSPDSCLTMQNLEKLITHGFDKVLNVFEKKLAYDAAKQQQIDSLHNELQKYRTDLIAKTNRPIVNGLIRLHDDIGRLLEKLKSSPPEELDHSRFIKSIDGIQDDLVILLDQNGIITFRESPDDFNPRKQQAVKSIHTNDKSLNGIIVDRLRPGFEQGTEIIKKERVTVYVFNNLAGKEERPDYEQKLQIPTVQEFFPQSTEEKGENDV